ncbi:MAG: sulfotransferase [Desulfobacteraceae bacterium]|nr:sulfotransferase [Desulfobacteraceae bacterium]
MNYKTFIRKVNRRVKREIFSRLYLDSGKEKDFILVFGSGRGGTTWLADAISQAFAYRLIFEPFWHLHIEVDGIRDFFHHRYISIEDNSYNNHIKYVMSGKYKNMRTNMNYRYGPYRGRVIKDICANLFMEKILQIFPQAPIVFVIRHPCAVVLSRLRKGRWSAHWGWHAHLFNNQKDLIKAYFNNKKFIPRDELEDHAITYCYENYLPLLIRNENIYFVYYEKLVLDIRSEMENILNYVEKRRNQRRCIDSLQEIKIRYLITSQDRQMSLLKDRVKHLYSWRNDLDTTDIERIKKIVRQFRLENVYEEIEELVMPECD